jgi:hypothetical protein
MKYYTQDHCLLVFVVNVLNLFATVAFELKTLLVLLLVEIINGTGEKGKLGSDNQALPEVEKLRIALPIV